jgi:lysyl-tRNA synthetase class 1
VHHIHSGNVPQSALPISYGLLLNLVSLPGLQDKDIAWKFVQRYAPDTSPESDPELDELIGLAVNYARDFLVPALKRRAPTKMEADALRDLDCELSKLSSESSAEDIQTQVFEVGKRHPFESLRSWFEALYETLLGSSRGPRMGSFIALYGIENSRRLIAEALERA